MVHAATSAIRMLYGFLAMVYGLLAPPALRMLYGSLARHPIASGWITPRHGRHAGRPRGSRPLGHAGRAHGARTATAPAAALR